MLFPNAGVEVSPALLLLLGLMVGTLSGFFGIGGGFLITGGLLVFGVPPLFAVGTGLTLIMGSSIINTLKHRSIGNVDFKLGSLMIVGIVPAMFLAKWVNTQLEEAGVAGPVLRYTYVAFLAGLGWFLLYDYWKVRSVSGPNTNVASTSKFASKVQSLRIFPFFIPLPGRPSLSTAIALPASNISSISSWIPIGIGFAIGFLAGLLGAGGGFILLPVLIYVLGVPTAIAIGTSLFQVMITGALGTVLYSLADRVDLIMVVMMLGTASIGSQLGVAATQYVHGVKIRLLYGLTLASGSVSVALKQVSESISSLEYLADVASILLLGTAGIMCLTIGVMFVAAKAQGRSAKSAAELDRP